MNRNQKLAKCCISMALSALLLLSPVGYFGAEQVFGATQYEMKTEKTVTRGVTYEKSSRMTDAGVQNIHVMKVDLTESALEIREVESTGEYGLKETVKKLLQDNGAVAGVNSDFFGLSGTHSAAFGPIVREGEVISAGTSLNKTEGQYAAFFVDEEGNPFFDYFTMTAKFGNEKKMLELSGMNKFASLVFPAYLDQNAMADTKSLDTRFEKLVKFVVEDDVITYISREGETVSVPEDGYVIVMSAEYYKNAANMFAVEDAVELDITSSVELDEMQTSFGGGGKLLVNGRITTENSIVAKGRQPRTAFGISKDGNTAIFMVVDGRGDSIGATHWELGVLMQEYGAYEAMHLDGGGSSTMVAQTNEDRELTVQNDVSEGSERKVINAVGIFNHGEKGEIQELKIQADMTRTLPGKGITFTVYGLDENQNRIEIPAESVDMSAIGVEGTWDGYVFTPAAPGTFTVTATYNEMGAFHIGAVCGKAARLAPSKDELKLNIGNKATIAMQVIDEDGFAHWASTSTTYTVGDPSVGTMEKNVFTAKETGSTNIRCEKDGVVSYITVIVGDSEAAEKPEGTVWKDPLNQKVERTADGAYYFNVAGKIAYTGKEEIEKKVYDDTRSKVKSYVDANAEVAIYGGPNDIQSAKKLDSLSWTGEYRFLNRGGVSLAMVTAAKGGITATDPTQWGKFTADIAEAGNDTIVLVMDQTPSDFKSAGETNYLRAVLNQYVEQGKQVFVISCYGTAYWSSIKDGVRYINLPNLWGADGTMNDDYTMLRFRVKDGAVTYENVVIQ
ncbi:MAG: phosphodiester glycosidase family protein [Bacillota bacterium]|nr:phosphodiester glycosidase family protein [Bacillota bacterium]